MIRISIIVALVLLTSSCREPDSNGDTCGGLSNFPRFYDIKALNAVNYNYTGAESERYRYGNVQLIQVDQAILATSFVVELNAEVNLTLVKNTQPPFFNFALIKSAAACSPAPPSTYEVISQFDITSDSDFSENFLAGTNLNSLFFIKKTWGSGVDAIIDRSIFTEHDNNINNFVLASPPGMQRIHMMLSGSPTMSKTHNFKIDYMHTNGEYFEIILDPVVFQ